VYAKEEKRGKIAESVVWDAREGEKPKWKKEKGLFYCRGKPRATIRRFLEEDRFAVG